MLKTTIAGSLPKPGWLADPSAQLFAPWMVPTERLREAQDDAVRLALTTRKRPTSTSSRTGSSDAVTISGDSWRA
jgi:hypothetical protein